MPKVGDVTRATEPPIQISEHPYTEVKAADGRIFYLYDYEGQQILLPKKQEEMTEQEFYKLPFTVFDTTQGRLPGNLTVEFKDPQWAGYWFNRRAGGGQRLGTADALGFTPAKKEDLKFYWKGLKDSDGAIECHDLVLMKCPKFVLYFRFKAAMDEGLKRGGIKRFANEASSNLTPSVASQIDYYLTAQAEQEHQGLGPVVHYPTVSSQPQAGSTRPVRARN